MPTILFACIRNSGRSQMSAAWFNLLVSEESGAKAISAGSQPGDAIYPETITVMLEVGADLSHVKPQKLTEELVKTVDIVVTMGCGEACPYVPGVEIVAWTIPDPHGATLDDTRAIRDLLKGKVAELVQQRGWARAEA